MFLPIRQTLRGGLLAGTFDAAFEELERQKRHGSPNRG